MRRCLLPVVLVAAGAGGARAGDARDAVARLGAQPAVRAALEAVRRGEPELIEEQIRLSEIPAPPFAEGARAAAFRDRLAALGLERVRIDAEGNALGERSGRGPRPHLVLSAHLDTVFPEGTDVSVSREGALLRGPGIGDDARGLAVLLGVIRALDAARIETGGPITVAATVGEEGLGDLRGVKHLFAEELRAPVDAFVSVDGSGHGITAAAVGSHRYRVRFAGPGGHSYGAFGLVNPIHALGRAIGRIAELEVPEEPRTTFNVGRVGGGTSINSIAYEAWMEVDLRSLEPAALAALDARFHAAVAAAAAAERARWGGDPRLTVRAERVGTRPAAQPPESSPIVRTAIAATEAVGLPFAGAEPGSTDANLPMSLGIPALTIDGGGRGQGSHSLAESFDTSESWLGTQRALLLALALTEPRADQGAGGARP